MWYASYFFTGRQSPPRWEHFKNCLRMQSSVERIPCESTCWACIHEAWERRRGRGEGLVVRARWILWTGFLLPLRCKDQHLRHFSFSWNTRLVIGLKSNQMQSWLVFASFFSPFADSMQDYCYWWIVIPPHGMMKPYIDFGLTWVEHFTNIGGLRIFFA